jgi:hypothetical protein
MYKQKLLNSSRGVGRHLTLSSGAGEVRETDLHLGIARICRMMSCLLMLSSKLVTMDFQRLWKGLYGRGQRQRAMLNASGHLYRQLRLAVP